MNPNFGGFSWADSPWAGKSPTATKASSPPGTPGPSLGIPFDLYLIMRRRRPAPPGPPTAMLGIPFDLYFIMKRRRPLVVAVAPEDESSILLCL